MAITRRRGLYSRRPLDQELPQPKDPLSSLPNTCVYAILEHFTVVELIGVQRVSCGWKDAVDWKLAGIMRKCRPEPVEGADEEQAILEFRRDIYRQQARNDGKPTFVRRFTHATQGFAMCGDYFCWIDDTCLNVQLVFNRNRTRLPPQVEWRHLTWLFGANSVSVETIKPQEVGSITDQPLLMIKFAGKRKSAHSAQDESIPPRQVFATRPFMAVIRVKSRKVLWSTANDNPFHSSNPRGKLVTLNHTALAYINLGLLSLRPTLYVRDVLTGEIKATKPIPGDLLPFPIIESIEIRLHPRRDLVYLSVRGKVLFFSTTTANCLGRLSVAGVSSIIPPFYQFGPQDVRLRLQFSERQPKCSPSAPERFFLYHLVCDSGAAGFPAYCCFEYGIPTEEDISTSEARALQNGGQGGGEGEFISKVLRIQIYEHRARATEGPPELNPMLKQLALSEMRSVDGVNHTQVRFRSYTRHHSLPESTYDIFLEPNKPHDGSIPIEFYPPNSGGVLVTKPRVVPGRVRRHNERARCALPMIFNAPIMLTERYMLLTHKSDVYLFSYDPGW